MGFYYKPAIKTTQWYSRPLFFCKEVEKKLLRTHFSRGERNVRVTAVALAHSVQPHCVSSATHTLNARHDDELIRRDRNRAAPEIDSSEA